MSKDEEASEPPLTFTLKVHNSTIPCSKRVVLSSSLLVDIMELIKDDSDSPIPIPRFITKQIVLDWTEMVEKGDLECAHLVLVSLSYLLDFLIAVDFLGCDKLKSSVENKIKEKIDETNWREVLSYTKDIMGLENTTKAALEHIMKDLVKLYNDIELDKEGEDPYILDYCGMSPNMIKLLFKSQTNTSDIVKMHLIKNWVKHNSFKDNQVGVFDLLRCVEFKELSDGQIKSITDQVNSWPLTEEQFMMFSQMVETAKKEREELQDKRKKFRSNRFTSYQEWRENRRSFWSEMRIHLPGPPPPAQAQFLPIEELQFWEEEEMMMFNNEQGDVMVEFAGVGDVPAPAPENL